MNTVNTAPDSNLIEGERTARQTWRDAETHQVAMGLRYLEAVRRGEEVRKEGKERRADYLTAVEQTTAWSWVWCIAQGRLKGKEPELGHSIAAKARPVPNLPC